MMGDLPAKLRGSLSWDRGTEMAEDRQITAAMGMSVNSREPHSPWQRGPNENTHGLLRNSFPKGTDLAAHSAEGVVQVQNELNNRPRKSLRWQSPTMAMRGLQSAYS